MTSVSEILIVAGLVDQATAFLEWFALYESASELHTCRHGHRECSTRPGGGCSNEICHTLDDVTRRAIEALESIRLREGLS